MANNTSKNQSHYEYELNRTPKKIDQVDTYGFWTKVNLLAKTEVKNNNDDPNKNENLLDDPKKATTENGWISPMEFYSNKANINVNESRDVNNGMIQKKDIIVHKFKDLYWWCEDLHNWCVYEATCDGITYLNMFKLLVWNGRDGWEPINGYRIDESKTFSPLQNTFFQKMEIFGQTVPLNRGMDLRIGTNFTRGPLTINHGILLNKTNKYSINSSNQFQTLRWSGNKHISNSSEFTDYMYYITSGTNKRTKFVVKFRNAIRNGIELITQDDYDEQNSPYTDTQDHNIQSRSTDMKVKRTNIDVGYMNSKDDTEGYGIYATKQKPVWRYNGDEWDDNKGSNLHYMHAIDNSIDTPLTQKDRPEKIKTKQDAERWDSCRITPINLYHHKYNHAAFKAIVWDKIFALYFVDSNGKFFNTSIARQIFPDAWNASLDDPNSLDSKDVLTYDDGTKIYPIYVSILDLLFIFKGLNFDELGSADQGWGNSGKDNIATYSELDWLGPDTKAGTIKFTKDTWRSRNEYLLKKIYTIINQAFIDGFDYTTYTVTDTEKFNKWIEQAKSLSYPTDEPVKIFYSTKKDSEDKCGILYLYEFGWYSEDKSRFKESWYEPTTTYNIGHTLDIFTTMENDQNFNTARFQTDFEDGFRRGFGDNVVAGSIGYTLGSIVGGLVIEPVTDVVTGLYTTAKYDVRAVKKLGSIAKDIVSFDVKALWNDTLAFWESTGAAIGSALNTVFEVVKSPFTWGYNFITGGEKDKVILKYNYSRYDAKMKALDNNAIVESSETHYDIGESWRENCKKLINDIVNGIVDCNDRMNNSVNFMPLASSFDNNFSITPEKSYLREGISTGNPAVWRTATGQIMLSTFLVWGGKEGLIGGPTKKMLDEETGEEIIVDTGNHYAETFINNLCQDWFGNGKDKTINNHWLKEYVIDKDEVATKNSLITVGALEAGKVLEQFGIIQKNKLKIKLNTYRPTIVTTGDQINIDIAKKW